MKKITSVLAAAFALSATPALAHVGVGDVHDFSGGLLHPLSGLDHMLAALAVGLWAALAGSRQPFVWPAVFVGTMTLATFAGAAGFHLPFGEPAIAGSVLALGLLIALMVRASAWVGAVLIAAFAVVHGHAHGAEGGAALPYLAGLMVATAVLHVAGVATGRLAVTWNVPVLARGAGGLIAAAGVAMLVAG
jgi:urease accessory protein